MLENPKVRIALVILGGILASILLIYFIFQGGEAIFSRQLKLASTSPNNNTALEDPSAQIEFVFNKDVANFSLGHTTIQLSPIFEYESEFTGNKIILKPRKRLIEGVNYNIILKDVVDNSGKETLQTVSLVFTVREDSKRGEFIRKMPQRGDGFNISYLKNDGRFFVQIQKSPEESIKAKVSELFSSNGVDINNEEVKFEVLRSIRGDGAPASEPPPNDDLDL